MTKHKIRRATIEDLDLLTKLRIVTLTERGSSEEVLSAATELHLRDRLDKNLFALLLEDKAYGIAFVEIHDSLPSAQNVYGRFAQLRGVWIDPELRDKQLGTSLVIEAILEARLHGVSYVEAHVQPDLEKIFTRVGFAKTDNGLRLNFK